MTQPTFDDLPRRVQNRARTRVALVEALLPLLAEQSLDAVPVSALAEAANISQATFFNYFPTKADLLTHFIQLWGLRVGARARRIRRETDSALQAIATLYSDTAEQMVDGPTVMPEIIAHMAANSSEILPPPIELAERLLWLPGEPDVESLSDQGLGGLLPELIQEAIQTGELPRGTPVDSTTLAAASIFFGVPLLLSRREPASIAPLYQHHLQLLWAGVRLVHTTEESSR
jgi:AcrR family transcriptional regulator